MDAHTTGWQARVRAHGKAAAVATAAVAALSGGAFAISAGTASGSAGSDGHPAQADHSRPLAAHTKGHPVRPGHPSTVLTLGRAQLPVRRELGTWTVAPGDGPVLVCVPEDVMASLAPRATQTVGFSAYGPGRPAGGPFRARIGEQVLEFADPGAAAGAMQSVASWVHDCAARDLDRPGSIETRTVTGRGQGFWETYLRSARAICTECDAVYFDRQAVVRSGNRLVLLSLDEVGGPLEPEGLARSMRSLVGVAVTTASRA